MVENPELKRSLLNFLSYCHFEQQTFLANGDFLEWNLVGSHRDPT